jgi:membrane protease YdiL (CAAX protease family)
VRTLMARALDYRRIPNIGWYAVLLLAAPAVCVASFFVQRALGVTVPPPRIAPLATLLLSLFFLVGAICEELGWSGYALEPLQGRFGALRASLILGLVWAAWHLIPLAQVGRSGVWIAWWALGTVAARVLMVQLFNRTGRSVFGQALFHAASNLAWQLYPVQGSFWDPAIYGPLMAVAAAAMVIAGGSRRPSLRSPP